MIAAPLTQDSTGILHLGRRSKVTTGYGRPCEVQKFEAETVSSNPESSDPRPPANFGEIPSDPLGDTQLGRGLRELIKEIGREKEALRDGLVADEGVGTESQDGDAFDSSQSRFDQILELAAPTQEGPAAAGNGVQRPAGAQEAGSHAGNPGGVAQTEISRAMSEIEQVLQRFAEAERRRSEDLIAESKVQFKKATMIVVKKQIDAARTKWMKNLSAHESAIAEHYRRLKVLADKVAKQKAQIQLAKKELEDKLRVADQLHSEFDEIRDVLDGQIDAIDALDKSDDPTEL